MPTTHKDDHDVGSEEFDRIVGRTYDPTEQARLERIASGEENNGQPLHADEEAAVERARERLRGQEDDATDTAAASTSRSRDGGAARAARDEAAPGWNTNLGRSTGGRGKNLRTRLTGRVAKRWLIGAIITAVTGFFVTAAGAPAGMIFQLKEVATRWADKFGLSANSRKAIKTSKRIFTKPDPSCSPEKIKCRLKLGVSDREIKKYEKAGLKPKVEQVGSKKYITSFTVTGKDGAVTTVTQDNFAEHYRRNAKFRAGIESAANTRALWWRSAAAIKNYVKFKVNRKNPVGDKTTTKEEDIKKAYHDSAYQENADDDSIKTRDQLKEDNPEAAEVAADENAKVSGGEDPSAELAPKAGELNGADSTAISKALTLTKDVVKGAVFGVLSVVDNACSFSRIIRSLVVGAKILGAAQLIRYAGIFLTLADQTKAGQSNYQQVSTIANAITKPSTVNDDSKGKTFFNSEGWTMVSQGALGTTSGIGRFTTGTAALRFLDKARVWLSSTLNTLGLSPSTCKKIGSWPAQLALAVLGIILDIVSGGGSSMVGVAVNIGGAILIDVVAYYATPLLIQYIAGTLAPALSDAQGGYAIGNAFAAGVGALSLWKHGKTSGLHPVSRTDFAQVAYEADKDYASYLAAEHYGKNAFSLDEPDSIPHKFALAIAPFFAAPLSAPSMQHVAAIVANPFSLVAGTGGGLLMGRGMAASGEDYGARACHDEDYQNFYNKVGIATDGACNPIYVGPTEYEEFETVVQYMIDNGHVDEEGKVKSDDFQEFIDICINGETPVSPIEGDDETPDTRRCVPKTSDSKSEEETETGGKKEEMMRQYLDYMNYLDAVDKSIDGTLGQGGGDGSDGSGGTSGDNGGSNSNVAACKDGSAAKDDNVQILCRALPFDPYGYLWGGGHGSLASLKDAIAMAKAGRNKGRALVDCSGLVRAAIYDAFGTDVNGTAGSQVASSNFKKIDFKDAKPGDVLFRANGHNGQQEHIAIVESNDTGKRSFKIFHASTSSAPIAQQIAEGTRSYGDYTAAYRYVGAKK